eukprot:gene4375-14500_t
MLKNLLRCFSDYEAPASQGGATPTQSAPPPLGHLTSLGTVTTASYTASQFAIPTLPTLPTTAQPFNLEGSASQQLLSVLHPKSIAFRILSPSRLESMSQSVQDNIHDRVLTLPSRKSNPGDSLNNGQAPYPSIMYLQLISPPSLGADESGVLAWEPCLASAFQEFGRLILEDFNFAEILNEQVSSIFMDGPKLSPRTYHFKTMTGLAQYWAGDVDALHARITHQKNLETYCMEPLLVLAPGEAVVYPDRSLQRLAVQPVPGGH